MIFPQSQSFTHLSTFPLPSQHYLHPKACNPAMDLIVLLSPYPAPTAAPAPTSMQLHMMRMRGLGGNLKDEGKTKVSLWRTGGDKVWEVDVGGRVGGMAWMEDGLHLSLLVMSSSKNTTETLSVHSGEVARSVPLELDVPDLQDGQWLDMEYRDSGLRWEKPMNGSAPMIIDSLPRVTPVEPPKPINVLPFMRPKEQVSPKPTLHPRLISFPALLPANPPTPPTVLHIQARDASSISLLTGTFQLPSIPSVELLSLAQVSDRITGLLDIVLRGLESAEAAFREGDKQTMIHREDLETCAKQQGTSIPDVYADLFRFLMTGRTGIAVNEWLGSRMTPRTIAKWDSTMDSSYRTIQKLISESITPALERILLLLEEIKGWSLTRRYIENLNLGSLSAIQRCMDLVSGLGKLVEGMRVHAKHELMAASEFIKWLKYEASRTTIQDRSTDDYPYAVHDLKYVWAFMENGFVKPRFRRHFPDLLERERPPQDLLPEEFISRLGVKPEKRLLSEVLQETLTCLKKPPGSGSGYGSEAMPSQADQQSASQSMSMSLTAAGDDSLFRDGFGVADLSLSSSADTIAAPKDDLAHQQEADGEEGEKTVARVLEEEPWVWANTVVEKCEELVKNAAGKEGRDAGRPDRGVKEWAGIKDVRVVGDGGTWMALLWANSNGNEQMWLIYDHPEEPARITAFQLHSDEESAICLAIQFFDDEELVLLLEETKSGQRYLVTARYADLLEDMSVVPEDIGMWDVSMLVEMGQREVTELPAIPISRCRPLATRHPQAVSIALNGRKGRRLGCILVESEDDREVEVLDLDADEDEEEEGEEPEEEDGIEYGGQHWDGDVI
ncbi:hypothetical protein C366_04983 [Cryptococcus neoformans Tu401-1]|nr:hypothetical protein C366_04983 [Cryptococcus neoformans var. grubii Tu401-1]OXM77410.1 hypothetical protein C364_04970 [Cryptococcus neoformans var. grubii Bt63]